MRTDLLSDFETLRRHYGSHTAAARTIGMARDHYRALRNGRANIPPRTAELIRLKAAEVAMQDVAMPPPLHLQNTGAGAEARV